MINASKTAAIQAILSGKTAAETAGSAGVSERTLSRWRADPEFSAAVNSAAEGIITQAAHALAAAAKEAVTVALAVMKNAGEDSRVRLSAARLILDTAPKWAETAELMRRLDALEKETFKQHDT